MEIGIITVRQPPRKAVVEEIEQILHEVESTQRGCLDGLTKQQMESLNPEETEPFFVTVLRDGSSVQVSKEKTVQLLQQRIKRCQSKDVSSTVPPCGEDFPNLKTKKLLIPPESSFARRSKQY